MKKMYCDICQHEIHEFYIRVINNTEKELCFDCKNIFEQKVQELFNNLKITHHEVKEYLHEEGQF